MRNFVIAMLCTAVIAGATATSVAPAKADINIWTGQVVHVSTTNIKVHNRDGNETLSFLLLPKFKQLFSDDGKTTYQMAMIKPGMWVTVYYDQDLLGARHADKIVVLNSGKSIKS
ncbi:MAG TPA: hypothetical protein VGQ96_06925 [Candidatus Eremiobacteraceae bacterium]|nr:hypothetical protein [Candidatus Eremiobacteraceae bacterium]